MIVGLTGGIGSGKSTIAKLFEIFGCVIFDSDSVAKQLYFDPIIKSHIIKLLGEESYISENKINKKYISSIIFSNSNKLEQLNQIIHPAVIIELKKIKEKNPDKIIIKETALLFEAKLEKEVDKIILVVSPQEDRIKRVMLRDGISKEDVLKKIKNQLPDAIKIKKSDFIIENNEKEFLITQSLKIYNSIIT